MNNETKNNTYKNYSELKDKAYKYHRRVFKSTPCSICGWYAKCSKCGVCQNCQDALAMDCCDEAIKKTDKIINNINKINNRD